MSDVAEKAKVSEVQPEKQRTHLNDNLQAEGNPRVKTGAGEKAITKAGPTEAHQTFEYTNIYAETCKHYESPVEKNLTPGDRQPKGIEYAGEAKTTKSANETATEVASKLNEKPNGTNLDLNRVSIDLLPKLNEIGSIALGPTHLDHVNSVLISSTKNPPGLQNNYNANATKEIENRVMTVLTGGKDGNIELSEAQKASLSQKDLVSLVNKIAPDKETADLTLANLTKNITGLTRNEVTGSESNWNRSYNQADAKKVAAMLQPLGTNTTSDKMGNIYHFYGALASTYFNGVVGGLMVDADTVPRKASDEKKIANETGKSAAYYLFDHDKRIEGY
jgi:hypothetical protein